MLKRTRDAPQTTRALAAASVSAPLDLRANEVLAGKYLLVRPLGAGGMGQVWAARNLATQAEVAAKVLLPERVVVGDALERFRREAQATASLWHRGIVRAFDLVELDPEKGSLLLVMELLHGQTLAQRLEQAGRLTVAETLGVLVPILSALDHAHRVGVVHRDLKPDNVFLAMDPDGEIIPKLVDFGISKMRHASTVITARGALIGTPYYMSPEQARAETVDGRSDVFAVGILLYECLSGAPPFGGQTLNDIVRAVLETEPPPLPAQSDLPSGLRAVIARALAKRPDERYATAAELADAIVAAVPAAAAVARPTSAPPGPPSMVSVPPAVAHTTIAPRAPGRSRRALVAWGAIVGSVIALGIGSLRGAMDRRAPTMAGAAVPARAPSADKHVTTDLDVMSAAPVAPPSPRHPVSNVLPRRPAAAPSPSLPAIAPPADPPSPVVVPPPTLVRDPGF
jgi:serine/threonine protein kinase